MQLTRLQRYNGPMKKIFITGSTTGLGFLAGQQLLDQGHQVVFHARNEKSALEAKRKLNKDVPFVIGDVSNIEDIKSVARQANSLGPFDVIIHNVGVYEANSKTLLTVNVLTPFILSTTLQQPERMVFLSSGMHLSGEMNLEAPNYSDSKLYDLMLTKYFARKWPGTYINAVDPGWVPTRMGGAGAPDDLLKGAETQVWLSVSNDSEALVSGKYFHHKKQRKSNPLADSSDIQDRLVAHLKSI